MFVGHFGVGFAAKKLAPETSLGTLVLAAMLADVLFLIFLPAGLEHIRIAPGITRLNALDLYDIALSHSVLTDVLWAGLFAGAYFARRRYPAGAWAIIVAVLSHWLLDFVSHRPDMPLVPGIPRYFGLGLYNSPVGLLIVEGLIWFGGIALYLRSTRAPSGRKSRAGTLVLWIGVALLSALWLLSFSRAPPPSVRVFVIVDLIAFPILIGWTYWVDRLRQADADVRNALGHTARRSPGPPSGR